MTLLAMVSSILGAGITLLSVLSQTELWQRKEYRWDRLQALLKSPEAATLVWPWIAVAIFITDFAWISFLYGSLDAAEWLGFIGLLVFTAHHGFRIKKRGVFRPKLTNKAKLILFSIGVVLIAYLFFTFTFLEFVALQWATLLLFLPFITAVVVLVVNIPADIRKRQIINQATALRDSLSSLKVIGITGSYGKTSTKYFLSQILDFVEKKYIATTEHRNSELPVAQDMLKQLKKDSELYIVEMGAYRHHEIRDLAVLAKPQIGCITAIGNQHLDLFGSKQGILNTKWELVEALPLDGHAVLNADDELLIKKAKDLKIPITWYSLKQPKDVWTSEAIFESTNIMCTLHIGMQQQAITIPLASEALLGSVVAAVALAHTIKIPAEEIFLAVQQLQPYTRTMEIRTGKNKITIIDDSYSANEHGTVLAIKHLSRFKQLDKRIVLLPLIELGSDAEAVHERIGEALNQVEAEVFVAGTAYVESLQKHYEKKLHVVPDPKVLQQIVSKNLTAETVILLEGRLPDIVRQAIL